MRARITTSKGTEYKDITETEYYALLYNSGTAKVELVNDLCMQAHELALQLKEKLGTLETDEQRQAVIDFLLGRDHHG